MPTFAYTARTLGGELKNCDDGSRHRDEVVANLRRQKLIVVKVDEETRARRRAGRSRRATSSSSRVSSRR